MKTFHTTIRFDHYSGTELVCLAYEKIEAFKRFSQYLKAEYPYSKFELLLENIQELRYDRVLEFSYDG